MSYEEMARLDVLNAIQGIHTEEDYLDFRNYLARYFADKAQKAIDAMWDKGEITEETIEEWGNTKMRTPYHNATLHGNKRVHEVYGDVRGGMRLGTVETHTLACSPFQQFQQFQQNWRVGCACAGD